MKQYFGFKTDVQGITSVCLIPTGSEGAYQFGIFDYQEDQLTLISKDFKEEVKLFQKINEFGQGETKRDKHSNKELPLIERRLIKNNLTFNLSGGDIDWFIKNFVENDVIVSNLIEQSKKEYNDYVSKKTLKSAGESVLNSKDQQSFSPEAWGRLSGNSEESGIGEDNFEEEREDSELVGEIPLQ